MLNSCLGMVRRMSKIIILCLFLAGCASTAYIDRDELGRVEEIKVNGQMKGSVKTEAEEIHFDSKNEPILKDLVSINANKK